MAVLQLVNSILIEANKLWDQLQHKIIPRMKEQGVDSDHKEHFKKLLHDTDPTGTYHNWLTTKYANGGIHHLEDMVSRAKPALDIFHKAKLRNKVDPDIFKHQDLTSLENAVNEFKPQTVTHAEKAANESSHLDEKHWHIVMPHTVHASVHYGRGTHWCTAADSKGNMFDKYSKQGPLVYFLPKHGDPVRGKLALHMSDDKASVYDHNDNVLDRKQVNSIFKEHPSTFWNKLVD